ncbi:unnamed protein product [Pedinophyceae sp. YPF-701]|nr:unnamed protein product [Pedinophyceae sp. YPF-701]
MIVSGHFNGALRFWDLRSGKDIKELSGVHGSGVAIASIAAASSDTGDVISIGRNNAAAIIDVRTYGVRLRLRSDHLRLSYGPVSGCFSPDGRYVAVGSSSGQTVTWRSSDGVVEKVLHGTQDLNHSSQVQCVAWGAGGHIVTGEKNGPAIIWSS